MIASFPGMPEPMIETIQGPGKMGSKLEPGRSSDVAEAGQAPPLRHRGFPHDAMIVNEARWLSADALFLVRVRPGRISGAYVGGQMFLGQTLGLFAPKSPLAFARADRVLPALSTGPDTEAFLELHRKNFQLAVEDVRGIDVTSRRALWTAGVKNSGIIRVVLAEGATKSWILLGEQDVSAAADLLQRSGFAVRAP